MAATLRKCTQKNQLADGLSAGCRRPWIPCCVPSNNGVLGADVGKAAPADPEGHQAWEELAGMAPMTKAMGAGTMLQKFGQEPGALQLPPEQTADAAMVVADSDLTGF
jgi:hypothetical protein